MPAYAVILDLAISGYTLVTGADAMVVFAVDETQAREVSRTTFSSEGLAWVDDSAVVEVEAAEDWNGWVFEVSILGGFGDKSNDSETVTVTGDATNNTIDEIGSLLVGELNGLTGITGAEYDSTSNLLTIAKGGGVDDLGDQFIEIEVIPPNGYSSVPSLIGAISEGGTSTDDLNVILPADDAVIPVLLAPFKQIFDADKIPPSKLFLL